jgi:hypothetical protein
MVICHREAWEGLGVIQEVNLLTTPEGRVEGVYCVFGLGRGDIGDIGSIGIVVEILEKVTDVSSFIESHVAVDVGVGDRAPTMPEGVTQGAYR